MSASPTSRLFYSCVGRVDKVDVCVTVSDQEEPHYLCIVLAV